MVISEETRAAIEAECRKFPQKRGALLAALHLVQKEHGCVSREVSEAVAELFGIRPVEVMEVVTFYNMFRSAPEGRHHVHLCTNLPCSLRGARSLLKRLEAHLGVESGQTTADGRITLGHEECLGACAYAPMMRVDGRYYEDLDFERAREILEALD